MIYRIGQWPLRSRCLQAGSSCGWFPDGALVPNWGCHETEYFCTDLYIADGVEDRQFIPAMVMGDAPNAEYLLFEPPRLCSRNGSRSSNFAFRRFAFRTSGSHRPPVQGQ